MPLTWELPAAAALCWVSVAVMLLLAGQGAASWLTGAGWTWPTAGGATVKLVGLFGGHTAPGLATTVSAAPSAGFVYLLVILIELAWLSVSLLGLRVWWRTWGPGMGEGLASWGEVEKVLGLSRMRADRKVIRPDLYAKSSAAGGRS
jgi:type IV secretion system protein VirD4